TGVNSIYSGTTQAVIRNSNASPSSVQALNWVSGPCVCFDTNSMLDHAEFHRRALAMSERSAQMSSRGAFITREADVEGIASGILRKLSARHAARSSPPARTRPPRAI